MPRFVPLINSHRRPPEIGSLPEVCSSSTKPLVCASVKRAGASPARVDDEWEAAVTISSRRSLYGYASIGIAAIALAMSVWTSAGAQQQDRASRDLARRQRFTHDSNMRREASAAFDMQRATEAPTGFDNRTNGFDPQGPPFDSIDEDNVVPLRSFNDNRFIFEEVETIADGLGPTYNAQCCRECHQNVVTGGASQIAEHRTGRLRTAQFFESLGGSLVHSRATHPDIMELVASKTTSARSGSRPIRSGPASSRRSPTTRCWRFAIISRRRCAARRSRGAGARSRTAPLASAGSAGRISTRASSRSPPTPISTRWASRRPLLPDENTSSWPRRGGLRSGAPIPRMTASTRGVRQLHARDQGAAARTDRLRTFVAGETIFKASAARTCHVADDRDGAAGHSDQRRRVHRSGGARQQDHPSVQRLPVARHRHGRRHPGAADAGVCVDGATDPYGAVVGTADAQSPDARRLSFTKEEAIERHAGQATAGSQRFGALTAAQKPLLMKFLNSL